VTDKDGNTINMTVNVAKNMSPSSSQFKTANAKLLEGNWVEAIKYYVDAILENPALAQTFEFNLRLAQNRHLQSVESGTKNKVMVCNLGSAITTERPYALLSTYINVANGIDSIACISAAHNTPFLTLMKSKAHTCHVIPTQQNSYFFHQAIDFVLAHPCNLVHLTSPEFPNAVFGLLYKWIWRASVIVDISDLSLHEKLSGIKFDANAFFVEQEKTENFSDLYSGEWTYIGCNVLNQFDLVTCSNVGLQHLSPGIQIIETEQQLSEAIVTCSINIKNKASLSLQHNPTLTVIILKSCSSLSEREKAREAYGPFSTPASNLKIVRHGGDYPSNNKDIELIVNSGLFDESWYTDKYLKDDVNNQDPILHYLTVGSSLGFDPCLDFSSEHYLRRYKSVAKSGVNPLLHYIKHGKSKGYLPKIKNNLEPKGEFGAIDIYLSCWLRNRESIHDGVLNLYKILRNKGARVKFVTHSEPILELSNIDAYNVSFSLLDTPLYFNHSEFVIPEELAEELYSIIFLRVISSGAELTSPKQEVFQSLSEAYSFWRREFLFNKPELVIVWGSTCPISRLHIWLCKNLNIPYMVMERGHFSKTLSIDIQGQFAHGAGLFLPERLTYDYDFYIQIAKWVRDNEEVPYAHKNISQCIDPLVLEAKAQNRPVFLFIGVNEPGSGVAYSSHTIVERHSAFYHTSYSALLDAHQAISSVFDDFVLVFKPHPTDRADYSSLNLNGLVMEVESNINALIEISDVCISMSTTALARCIIEEKPILTMSYTDLNGLGIAYECFDKASLVQLIRDAYGKVDFDKRKESGRSFICNLFNRKLFSIYPEDSIMQGLDTFSNRIVQRMDMQSLLNKARDSNDSSIVLDPCLYRKFEYSIDAKPNDIGNIKIDVIIPVYSDVDLTKKAIYLALVAARDFQNVRVVIVNDCSPEPGMADMLHSFSHLNNVLILENKKNLGFSGSVNLAISQSLDRDVILLNSDAIVPPDFLIKLAGAAYCNSKVATVTPFSNNAGIAFSIPVGGKSLEVSDAEAFVAAHNDMIGCNKGLAIEVPSGHGFCLYIRRSAIRNIGLFDELTFGRGYSEEVDFCLRARSLGYVNIACLDLFVGHVGGVSFADEANERRLNNRKIIANKYKDYFDEIKNLKRNDPLRNYRII
jgi:GT2 family glycosyltransferase